MHYKERKFMKS